MNPWKFVNMFPTFSKQNVFYFEFFTALFLFVIIKNIHKNISTERQAPSTAIIKYYRFFKIEYEKFS